MQVSLNSNQNQFSLFSIRMSQLDKKQHSAQQHKLALFLHQNRRPFARYCTPCSASFLLLALFCYFETRKMKQQNENFNRFSVERQYPMLLCDIQALTAHMQLVSQRRVAAHLFPWVLIRGALYLREPSQIKCYNWRLRLCAVGCADFVHVKVILGKQRARRGHSAGGAHRWRR